MIKKKGKIFEISQEELEELIEIIDVLKNEVSTSRAQGYLSLAEFIVMKTIQP